MIELKEVNGEEFLLKKEAVDVVWLKKKEAVNDPDETYLLLSSGKQLLVIGDVRKEFKK